MERYDGLTRQELTDLLSESRKLVDSRDGGVDEAHRLVYDLQVHRLELELQNRDLRDSRQALEESRDRYLSLFDFAPVAYFIIDAAGLIRDVNLTGARMFGRERSRMVNRPFDRLFTEGSAVLTRAYLRRVFDAEGPVTEDFRLRAGDDGEGREVRLDGVVFGDENDGRTCLVSMVDVSEPRRMEREIREKHAELTSIVRAAPVGIGLVRERVFQWLSPRFTRMLGYSEEELLNRSSRIVYPDDAEFERVGREKYGQVRAKGIGETETRMRRKDGSELDVLLRSVALDPGDLTAGVMFTAWDITSQARTRERLYHLAYHDQLTDLPNRELFYENFTTLVQQARRHKVEMALLFIDLDRFKQVNDAHGHLAGDELLKEAAERILDSVRESDVVARLGGDEFLVLLPEISSVADAEEVARKINSSFEAPFAIDDAKVSCTASVGISNYPWDGEDVETLIRKADDAMYRHKLDSRGGSEGPLP